MDPEQEIEQQIGRKPQGHIKIVSWCATKRPHPQVIETYPLVNGKPFPTLYYLTCPYLVKAVSKLEDGNYVEKFQRLTDGNSIFKANFLASVKRYIDRRKFLLKKEDLEHLSEDERDVLFNSGVGGVKNIEKVKCLHAHYAHFLATGDNPVGEEIDKLISKEH